MHSIIQNITLLYFCTVRVIFSCLVVRSGDYYLFETDSEEEIEEEVKEDEEQPQKSGFQVMFWNYVTTHSIILAQRIIQHPTSD